MIKIDGILITMRHWFAGRISFNYASSIFNLFSNTQVEYFASAKPKLQRRMIFLEDALTRLNHARTNTITIRDKKKAGKAARMAKLISFALRIRSSSSIALIWNVFIRDV